jgi:glucokinase
MPEPQLSVGIDLGGTTFTVGIVDAQGHILRKAEDETHSQHCAPAELLSRIAALVKATVAKANAEGNVRAVGIGTPGPVVDGKTMFAPNLHGWDAPVPVRATLEGELNLPVAVMNDANAACYGEYKHGAGKGSANVVLLTLGTGIGGGIVLDNQLLIGSRGQAAEIGHTTIDLNGPRCGCGNHGCLEAFAGIHAIIARTFQLLQSGKPSLLTDMIQDDYSQLNQENIGKLLFQAAQKNDAVALEVFEMTGAYLGAAIESLVMILDPDKVILGGGVSRAGDFILQPIRRVVAARTPHLPFPPGNVVLAQLGNDAGVVGPAVWAREQVKIGQSVN